MTLASTISKWLAPKPEPSAFNMREAISFLMAIPEIAEAYSQADLELALDDQGWMAGGKRLQGQLDPLSRMKAVNLSRAYWQRDPLAKQAVRLWTDYAFGSDCVTIDCPDAPEDTKTISTYFTDRRNRRALSRKGMRRMSQKLLIDGELFYAFFEDGIVRTFDPLQITDFITDPDDEDHILAYKRVTAPTNPQQKIETFYYKPWDAQDDDAKLLAKVKDPTTGNVPELEDKVVMYHLAMDDVSQRGTPLLSAGLSWVNEHRRFMEARVAIQQALSRFAYKGKAKGGQKMVDSIANKMKSSYVDSGTSGGPERNPQNAPGGQFWSNDGVDLTPMPRVTGAGDAKTDGDSLKLQVCAATGIMLHYFGDPSTGNLATATAMELPMLKMFGAYQQLWKDAYRDIVSIVLEENPDEEDKEEVVIDMPAIIEDDLTSLGAFLTSVTAVFPEAKIPAVLKQCLQSMNVENVDEVMEDVEEQKKIVDAQAKVDADNQHQQAMALATAVPGKPAPPAKPVVPVKESEQTDAERMDKLTAALSQLAEVMR